MNSRRLAVLGICAGLLGGGGCAIPVQQEIDMGNRYARAIEDQLPIITDPAIQRALDDAIQPILAQTTRPDLRWRVRLIDLPTVNAFAVPGGHLYVFRGLVGAARAYDELAGVLAHEMAHVDLRHTVKQLERAQAANTGLGVLYAVLGRQPGALEATAINVGGAATFAKFSRDAEREADREAVAYMTAAGINPLGLARMFATLRDLRERDPGSVEQFFASHPQEEDRIRDVTQMILRSPGALVLRETGIRDHEAFDRLKRLLRERGVPAVD